MMNKTVRLLASLSFVLASQACGSSDDPAGEPDAGGEVEFTSPDRPSKRSDVISIADPRTNTIVMFGGDDGPIVDQIPKPEFLDETWMLDPTYGWTKIESSNAPSARGRSAVGYDPNGGRMLVFGGRYRLANTTGNYTIYNDLWEYNFETKKWTELHSGSGNAPAKRYLPGGAYDPNTDTFYVWGGAINTNPLAITPSMDLWALKDGSWSEITVSGQAPSRRTFVGVTYDDTRNELISFAGQVGDFSTLAYNDLYALKLDTGVWKRLHQGGSSAPPTRMTGAVVYDSVRDRYVLVGGHTDLGYANDVWAFDRNTGEWTMLHEGDAFTSNPLGCLGNSREIPENYVDQDVASPERRGSGVVQTLDSNLIWVFGGESDCSEHLDDTWSFDLNDNTWKEHVEARSGETCLRRGDDCQCACW